MLKINLSKFKYDKERFQKDPEYKNDVLLSIALVSSF